MIPLDLFSNVRKIFTLGKLVCLPISPVILYNTIGAIQQGIIRSNTPNSKESEMPFLHLQFYSGGSLHKKCVSLSSSSLLSYWSLAKTRLLMDSHFSNSKLVANATTRENVPADQIYQLLHLPVDRAESDIGHAGSN